MLIHDFIRNVIASYHAARQLVHPHPRLTRGTGRIVSSLAEEHFAHYLIARHPYLTRTFIDQEIRGACYPKMTKPDLALTHNGKLGVLIDLKMDMGYFRKQSELVTKVQDACAFMSAVRGNRMIASARRVDLTPQEIDAHCGGATGRRVPYALDVLSDARYFFVVICDGNISPAKASANIAVANEICKGEVTVLMLTQRPARLAANGKKTVYDPVHLNHPDFESVEEAFAAVSKAIKYPDVKLLDDTITEIFGQPSLVPQP